jgi:lysophospholipase L1-like esterase
MSEIRKWQMKYLIGAAAVAPISPLLLLQGQITRWKVGMLPGAEGDRKGVAGKGGPPAKLFVIGESTVAGLGASSHKFALAGQFALQLAQAIDRAVEWHVIGKNGVTARRTIDELIPHMPDERFDYILVGLGGNDVMKLSSPRKWRRDMLELLGLLRRKIPEAVIFISNCPMIVYSPIMPEPVKTILWKLSQMHNENIIEFTRDLDRVFYYPQPAEVSLDGFFADGIHPSEKGYADWSRAMIKYFKNYEW